MKHFILFIFCLAIGLVFFSGMNEDAGAVPSFARKYKTSCATCHTGFPKLNSFGEAFRQNGFQYPEDDAGKVKEEPVELGAESYKRVWPNAIWPGSIPGSVPIAFRARSGFTYEKNARPDKTFTAPTLQIISAGTLGENISFYVGAHLFEEGELGSIDRFYLKLNNLFSSVIGEKAVYFRFGQFIPEVVPFASNHRSLTITPYVLLILTICLWENRLQRNMCTETARSGSKTFSLGRRPAVFLHAATGM